MDFFELIRIRRSVRKFNGIPVEKEKIIKIMDAARLSPSAANLQPWNFIIVDDPDIKNKAASAYHGKWILQAPVIIVVCGDHRSSWKRPDGKDHCDIDVAIAVSHLMLAAAQMELGTCWIGGIDASICREVFNLPQNMEPVAYILLGYPADNAQLQAHNKERKDLNSVMSWNSFNE